MMKRLLILITCALALAACSRKEDPVGNPLAGIWELESVSTKVSVGDVNVSVYIDFSAEGSFTLYQQIGEGRFARFAGSYSLTSDNKLSGQYENGSLWGPYTAQIGENSIQLTTPGGREVDTYKKVSAIPASVTGNIY